LAALGLGVLTATASQAYYIGDIRARLELQTEITDAQNAETICKSELAATSSNKQPLVINIITPSNESGTTVSQESKQLSKE